MEQLTAKPGLEPTRSVKHTNHHNLVRLGFAVKGSAQDHIRLNLGRFGICYVNVGASF